MDDYTNTGTVCYQTTTSDGFVTRWCEETSSDGNPLIDTYTQPELPWYQDLWSWWLNDIWASDYGFAVLFGLMVCLFLTIGAILFVIQVLWPAISACYNWLRWGDYADNAWETEEYINELNMSAAGGHPYHALSQM